MSAQRPTALSREGRDVLWLLAILGLCMAPHAARLPLWCALGAATAIAWRAWLAWQDRALPPRWVLMVALLGSVGMTLLTHQSVFGREAGVTLVTLLAGLKTLELRARRDAFVVTSLGFFLILTQFLYSQSLPMALLMFVAMLGLLTSLVLAQRTLGRPSIASAMGTAAQAVLMGLPLMLALYLLFPRIGPLWSVPSDAGRHTGLSEQLTLGNVADLALDDSIAMRVRFAGPVPAPHQLYFRGPVLEQFDGRVWRTFPLRPAQDAPAPFTAEALRSPQAIAYRVTLEPTRLNMIPFLEGTLSAQPSPPLTEPTVRRVGPVWLAPGALTDRTQFDAVALPGLPHGQSLGPVALQAWTQLPAGFNPRTLAWALRTARRADLAQADNLTLMRAVLQHIRQSGFSYTLAPGDDPRLPNGQPDPNLVDHFWLDTRRGFCEHFATAFVVVLRAMNVPSRVITGYQGAELNPIDGQYVVRNSDAHAWAEVWQPGVGWVRVDPTAAVAPERVERARPALRRPSALPGPLGQLDPTSWVGLRDYVDAGNHRWNVWVLEYSRSKQKSLLRSWGLDATDWSDLLRLCALVLATFSLGGLLWLWLARPRQPSSPWHRPMCRVHQALVGAGLPAPGGSPVPAPALTWAQHLQDKASTAEPTLTTAHGSVLPAMIEALRTLDALRYAPHPDRAAAAAVVKQIELLARQHRARPRPARRA